MIILIILFSILGGLLGSFAGEDNTSKLWRRVGIPVIIYLNSLFLGVFWLQLSLFSLIGSLSLGYGRKGNMGLFWTKFVGSNEFKVDFCCRLTVALAVCCSILSIPIIKGNWLPYIIASLGICWVNFMCGVLHLFKGEFQFFKWTLSWEEFWLYSLETGVILCIIYF